MILFLYGKDTYRVNLQVSKMVQKFIQDRDPQKLNVAQFAANAKTTSEIIEQLHVAPFLAQKRMVVIKDIFSGKKETQQEISTKIKENTIPDSTVLVICAKEEKPKTKLGKELLKQLTSQKFVYKFDEMVGFKLEIWIADTLKQQGKSISKGACKLLASSTQNTWELINVLEQAKAYAGDNEIGIAQVKPFVAEVADDNIFHLVDAIISKQKKPIIKMVYEQYNQGKDAGYVIAMLIRQFRILLQLRDLYEREDVLNSNTLASRSGVHAFVVKKSMALVKQSSVAQLTKTYEALLGLDQKIKTGQQDQRLLLDLFIVEYTLQRI